MTTTPRGWPTTTPPYGPAVFIYEPTLTTAPQTDSAMTMTAPGAVWTTPPIKDPFEGKLLFIVTEFGPDHVVFQTATTNCAEAIRKHVAAFVTNFGIRFWVTPSVFSTDISPMQPYNRQHCVTITCPTSQVKEFDATIKLLGFESDLSSFYRTCGE